MTDINDNIDLGFPVKEIKVSTDAYITLKAVCSICGQPIDIGRAEFSGFGQELSLKLHPHKCSLVYMDYGPIEDKVMAAYAGSKNMCGFPYRPDNLNGSNNEGGSNK